MLKAQEADSEGQRTWVRSELAGADNSAELSAKRGQALGIFIDSIDVG